MGQKYPVDGFVCTNLTKVNASSHAGKGGFSGKAVEELSNQMIAKVYKFYHGPFDRAQGRLERSRDGGQKIVIGCGGVFCAEDAYKKIRLGASLIQLFTGMIFQGPQLIGEINRGLIQFLRRDNFNNIAEAVGADNKP